MSKKVFEAKLSEDSIKNLRQELIRYKDIELKNKCQMLVKRLSEIGLEIAKAKISESPMGAYASVRVETNDLKNGSNALLIATGAIKETEGREPFNILLAIEFGSGIFYNKNGNPNAGEFGLGPGTFPGQIHALEGDGWYYWNESLQQWKHTYGIKATMPMYEAGKKILESVNTIALEVFG